MAAVKRECEVTEAVERVSALTDDYLLSIPAGSELSMFDAVSDCFDSFGYRWEQSELGWILSKDGGKTYLISNDDMFDIHNEVWNRLQGKRELDFSKYEDQIVGLPYNIPFVLRDLAGTPLIQVTVKSSRGMDTVTVTVKDCEKDNITVQRETLIRGKDGPDTVCTASSADLRAIKESCSDPVLFEETEEEPFPGVYVEDGNSVNLHVYGKGKDADFSFLNLWTYENYLDDAPQTKQLYQIAEKVLKAASKASGMKLKLDMFT